MLLLVQLHAPACAGGWCVRGGSGRSVPRDVVARAGLLAMDRHALRGLRAGARTRAACSAWCYAQAASIGQHVRQVPPHVQRSGGAGMPTLLVPDGALPGARSPCAPRWALRGCHCGGTRLGAGGGRAGLIRCCVGRAAARTGQSVLNGVQMWVEDAAFGSSRHW